MALRLLRTIRLDASDTVVFATAAEPGEWAISGAFRFWDLDASTLSGKARQAFRASLLGVASFGCTTLAIVANATEADRESAIAQLARGLVRHAGAPDEAAARAAAAEEIAFAASLAEHPEGTLVAVERRIEDGEVRERFRTLHRRADRLQPARAFVIEPDEGEDTAEEAIDLVALARGTLP